MSSVEIEKNGNNARVELQQPLTLALARELKPQLQQLIAEGVSGVVFDLSSVDIVDSSGIGLLIATRNSLAKTGGGLRVVGVSQEIQHLFKAMRLDRHFEIEAKQVIGSL